MNKFRESGKNHRTGSLDNGEEERLIAIPGWAFASLLTLPFAYLLLAGLASGATLVAAAVVGLGLGALAGGLAAAALAGASLLLVALVINLFFIIFYRRPANLGTGFDESWLGLPAALGAVVGGVAGGGYAFIESTVFAEAVFGAAPAIVFALVLLAYVACRFYDSVAKSQIVALLRLPLIGRLRIPLFALLLYGLLLVGPGFGLATYLISSQLGWMATTNEQVLIHQQKAIDRLVSDFAGLQNALTHFDLGQPHASFAIALAIFWLFLLFFGINWFVSRSARSAVFVFVTAGVSNFAYALIAFWGDAAYPVVTSQITQTLSEVNALARAFIIGSLDFIANALDVRVEILRDVEPAATSLTRIVISMIEVSARLALLSETLQTWLDSFIKFYDEVKATYVFFGLASLLLWWKYALISRLLTPPQSRARE